MKSLHLVDGDFLLTEANGSTRLTALAPVPSDEKQVTVEGCFSDWDSSEWKALIQKAGIFRQPKLEEELREFRRKTEFHEIPIIDEDDPDEPEPEKVHTLLLRFSRDEEKLEIRGVATFQHTQGLRALGLCWNAGTRSWVADFSENLLKKAAGFVKENDVARSPDDIGYERCENCGRWKPEEKQCSC